MNPKDTVLNALNYYLKHIQIGEHHDGENRTNHALHCLDYIQNKGIVDRDWLISNNLFFVDVFSKYKGFLKSEMQSTTLDECTIAQLRKEHQIINTLLQALKQVFGIN